MRQMNGYLRKVLLTMADEDQSVRADLAADGSLFQGYHPKMAEVHNRNATRLTTIIEQYGWPGCRLVGEEGAHAAWLILQHAVGNPSLQRRGLELLRRAAEDGDVPLPQGAALEDRICFFEGRPQKYGTQFDWDESGQISPYPAEDMPGVDERRRLLGLGPLDEDIRRRRESMVQGNDKQPIDWGRRQREYLEWCRSVGWRK
jgi:hypothetical protein